jgi:hypothetical protein
VKRTTKRFESPSKSPEMTMQSSKPAAFSSTQKSDDGIQSNGHFDDSRHHEKKEQHKQELK